ncbi:ANTAR domain-containing protein [Nocardia terpenica]|uniref:Transcription antitermination regulator n=1 Tax=Nocardia terpenica TaxID=455432 RepID=A0A291RJG3_9NOCA|nr:ANTAR domain-containing protein [Nocardia terpenica]ATL67751.1 transcription antitermination regulator [Nocardia terpenica]
MPPNSDVPDEIASEWREFARERERAARAAAIARRYEQQADRPVASMRPFRLRMAKLHRAMEARHYACARLHRQYALRLQRWRAAGIAERRPLFMGTVADQLGMTSAVVTLFTEDRQELLTAASDGIARTAHDLEAVLGHGPARDAFVGRDVLVGTRAELIDRWTEYGSAVAELGVNAVVAVPLASVSRRVGALCAFSSHRAPAGVTATADRVADALANSVLLGAHDTRDDGITPRGTLFDEADYLETVNQAAGVLSVRSHCTVDAALALLRARAYTTNLPLPELARKILDGTSEL